MRVYDNWQVEKFAFLPFKLAYVTEWPYLGSLIRPLLHIHRWLCIKLLRFFPIHFGHMTAVTVTFEAAGFE